MQIDSIILRMDCVLVGITGEQDIFVFDISHIFYLAGTRTAQVYIGMFIYKTETICLLKAPKDPVAEGCLHVANSKAELMDGYV